MSFTAESIAPDDFTLAALRHGSDKYGTHLYTPIYDELFSRIRFRSMRILEIGVGGYNNTLAGGLGLAALADYFPKSQIVGLDIEMKNLRERERVTVVQGSQIDLMRLDEVWESYGPFDIIIDDGSHMPDHVLTTFRHLYPKMDNHGIYVVEDTQTSFWPMVGGRADGVNTIFELAAQIGIALHQAEAAAHGGIPVFRDMGLITTGIRTYRNLIVFERGDNEYPSNQAFSSSHENVLAVIESIKGLEETNPAPGQLLALIEIYKCGGDLLNARECARKAREKWADRREVLVFAYEFYKGLDDAEEMHSVARQLAGLLPDSDDVKRMLEESQPQR